MKVAFAQLNYTIGDFEGNSAKIIQHIEKAKNDGADLVVFSELSVTGYYPHDLLEKKEFIQKAENAEYGTHDLEEYEGKVSAEEIDKVVAKIIEKYHTCGYCKLTFDATKSFVCPRCAKTN